MRYLIGEARLRACAVLLLVAAVVWGCSGELKTDYQLVREYAARYVAAHPELEADTRAAILEADLRKGMTMDQVAAAWGPPVVVQRFRGGAVQYWFFGCHWPHLCTNPDDDSLFPEPDEIFQSRALFEDGRLVQWQS